MTELMPGIRRMAMGGWPPYAGELLEVEVARAAADQLGLQHRYLGATTAAELDSALEAIAESGRSGQ